MSSKAVTNRKIRRSKYAVDIMYRLWDEHNSCWVTVNSKSLWSLEHTPEKIRERMIEQGRNPETLSVERVFVTLK